MLIGLRGSLPVVRRKAAHCPISTLIVALFVKNMINLFRSLTNLEIIFAIFDLAFLCYVLCSLNYGMNC